MNLYENHNSLPPFYTINGVIVGGYLAHHGIKGQKWGVRRYQNEDGTYTTIGKERRNEGVSGAFRRAGAVLREKAGQAREKHKINRAVKRSLAGKKVRLSSMSEEQIEKFTKRLRVENTLLSELKVKAQTTRDIYNAKAERKTLMSRYAPMLVSSVTDIIKTKMGIEGDIKKSVKTEQQRGINELQKQQYMKPLEIERDKEVAKINAERDVQAKRAENEWRVTNDEARRRYELFKEARDKDEKVRKESAESFSEAATRRNEKARADAEAAKAERDADRDRRKVEATEYIRRSKEEHDSEEARKKDESRRKEEERANAEREARKREDDRVREERDAYLRGVREEREKSNADFERSMRERDEKFDRSMREREEKFERERPARLEALRNHPKKEEPKRTMEEIHRDHVRNEREEGREIADRAEDILRNTRKLERNVRELERRTGRRYKDTKRVIAISKDYEMDLVRRTTRPPED